MSCFWVVGVFLVFVVRFSFASFANVVTGGMWWRPFGVGYGTHLDGGGGGVGGLGLGQIVGLHSARPRRSTARQRWNPWSANSMAKIRLDLYETRYG